MALPSIIQAHELLALKHSKNLFLVDASNGENAILNYKKKHLEGAILVDLNTQLAAIKDDFSNGGRHPLPSIKEFATTLALLGISNTSHIVIYDDKNGANAAARFWWMLKAIGHKKVQVLNGGLKEAEKIGFPIKQGIDSKPATQSYNFENWKLPIAAIEEVEKASLSKNHLIIDVRENARYQGKNEPIDLIAGHIPKAINSPFSINLNSNGYFLSSNELKEKYQKIMKDFNSENVIVHCGSGVTACHTLLALSYAGLKIPKLYVGSWSEWSRNNKKMITSSSDKK